MVVYSKGFLVSSSDEGATLFTLTSTDEERKKALRIIYYDVTDEVDLDVNLEREKIVDGIPIEVIADAMPERVITLDVEIPVGQTLLGLLKSHGAGAPGILSGFLEYEILG